MINVACYRYIIIHAIFPCRLILPIPFEKLNNYNFISNLGIHTDSLDKAWFFQYSSTINLSEMKKFCQNVPHTYELQHHNGVKLAWWRLKLHAYWLFVRGFVRTSIKRNTKVPQTTSNAESVSMSRRPHEDMWLSELGDVQRECSSSIFPHTSLTQIARFMGPTRGPSGADRTQVGRMLAPWTLFSGNILRPE